MQQTLLKKLFMLGTEQKKLGGSTFFSLSPPSLQRITPSPTGLETKKRRMCKKLSPGEYEDMMEFTSVPLPYDPTLQVKGVVPTSPRVFKSAMMPYTLEFVTQHAQKTHRVMFKIGDDVRQDQLILQMITLMDDLLKRVRLDLRLTPYRVMSTGHLEGLVSSYLMRHPYDMWKHSYSSETQSLLSMPWESLVLPCQTLSGLCGIRRRDVHTRYRRSTLGQYSSQGERSAVSH